MTAEAESQIIHLGKSIMGVLESRIIHLEQEFLLLQEEMKMVQQDRVDERMGAELVRLRENLRGLGLDLQRDEHLVHWRYALKEWEGYALTPLQALEDVLTCFLQDQQRKEG